MESAVYEFIEKENLPPTGSRKAEKRPCYMFPNENSEQLDEDSLNQIIDVVPEGRVRNSTDIQSLCDLGSYNAIPPYNSGYSDGDASSGTPHSENEDIFISCFQGPSSVAANSTFLHSNNSQDPRDSTIYSTSENLHEKEVCDDSLPVVINNGHKRKFPSDFSNTIENGTSVLDNFKLYACKHCNGTFDSSASAFQHDCVHNKILKCVTCSHRIKSINELTTHNHDGNCILFIDVFSEIMNSNFSCSSKCTYNCFDMNTKELDCLKEKMASMSKSSLHQFLLNKLVTQAEYGFNEEYFVVEQHKLCHNFMISALSISKYMLTTVVKEFQAGIKLIIHGNVGKVYHSRKRDKVIAFIQHFSEIHCENSPDKMERVLPGYMNVKTIYCYYKENCGLENLLGEREFYRILKDNFSSSRKNFFLPRVVFQAANSHPKCNTCTKLNDLRIKHQHCEIDLKLLEGQKQTHLAEMRQKYLNFVYRQELAISQPSDYLNIGNDVYLEWNISNLFGCWDGDFKFSIILKKAFVRAPRNR